MIRHHINSQSQDVFTGSIKDLQRVSEWGRSFLHLAHGPIEGERVFRSTPAKNLLDVWALIPQPATLPSSTSLLPHQEQ